MSIAIEQGALRLVVEPALGAGIADFSLRGPARFHYPLMRRAPHGDGSSSNLACFTMAPWCNRIPAGRFTFGGREYGLRATAADHTAIHGDVRNRPWTLLDRTPMSARLMIDSRRCADMNWPFAFTAEIRYELTDTALVIDLSVANAGDGDMPAGCGLHPYFPRRLWDERDVVEIQAPCEGWYSARETVPTRAMERGPMTDRLAGLHPIPPDVNGSEIFGGFSGRARIRWPSSGVGLEFSCSPNLSHVVLFCPHHRTDATSPLPHFALEPQTHVTNTINLENEGWKNTGLVVLEPGQTLATRTTITVIR